MRLSALPSILGAVHKPTKNVQVNVYMGGGKDVCCYDGTLHIFTHCEDQWLWHMAFRNELQPAVGQYGENLDQRFGGLVEWNGGVLISATVESAQKKEAWRYFFRVDAEQNWTQVFDVIEKGILCDRAAQRYKLGGVVDLAGTLPPPVTPRMYMNPHEAYGRIEKLIDKAKSEELLEVAEVYIQ